jgi:hypothetical protein
MFYCLRFEIPRTWRARSPYLYPPGTGCPSYTPRHWVHFSLPPTTRRVRWRYSTLPPHRVNSLLQTVLHITYNNVNTVYIVIVQKYLYRCMRIRCRGNPSTELLPSESPGIVEVFTSRYLETGVCLFAYCIAAAVVYRVTA